MLWCEREYSMQASLLAEVSWYRIITEWEVLYWNSRPSAMREDLDFKYKTYHEVMMLFINVPHPFSIVLKRFHCSQEALSEIPKPIENNRKWVWWVYKGKKRDLYQHPCTFCDEAAIQNLGRFNQFWKQVQYSKLKCRTRDSPLLLVYTNGECQP